MHSNQPKDAIAPYLPAILLQRPKTSNANFPLPSRQVMTASVLFADISGFTRLTESYTKTGQGVEKLTEVLNSFFGKLVEQVSARGGDVIKFAGDALLAIWVTGEDDSDLGTAIRHAACCALEFQSETDRKIDGVSGELSLRTVISAGELQFMYLGGVLDRSMLVVLGDPLKQIALAIPDTEPGEVILTATAWSLVEDSGDGSHSSVWAVNVDSMLAPAGGSIPVHRPELTIQQSEQLKSFVPRAILSRMDADQSAWLGESRWATIIFVRLKDLRETTPLNDAQKAICRIQEALYCFEGSVNKISVDEKGVVLLGAMGLPPLAHEDDAIRGIFAALDIQSSLLEMGWTCSIGIASGRVYCGIVGGEFRREYTLIGDTVNLAARLMTASDEEVLCDEATMLGGSSSLNFEPRGKIEVKGKARPVLAFRPIDRSNRSMPDITNSQFVGRSQEVSAFREHIQHCFRSSKSHAMVVEGQPGIGKSRLVAEFIRLASTQQVLTVYGRGESIESTTPYFPWRTLFQAVRSWDGFSQHEDDWLDQVAAAGESSRDIRPLFPFLDAVFIGSSSKSLNVKETTGEVRAGNTRDILTEILKYIAKRARLQIVLEDVQWMDSSSWSLLRRIARDVSPLSLVLATRPMATPPMEFEELVAQDHVSLISLSPFSDHETGELLCHKFQLEWVAPQISRFVHARSAGNPFFTEQLAATLLESGQISIKDAQCKVATESGQLTNIGIPDSVKGVVVSRIDRLSPGPQLTLKVASVIGQQFAFQTLHDVFPVDAGRVGLAGHITATEDAELVRKSVDSTTPTYEFEHAIARDAVYELMLEDQRRRLHQSLAEWYESTFSNRLGPYLALIAFHWSQTNRLERTVNALEQAGEQALRDFANDEAIDYFSSAIRIHRKDPRISDSTRCARWERQLAEAYYSLGHSSECIEHLDRCLQLSGYAFPRGKWKLFISTMFRGLWEWLQPVMTAPTQQVGNQPKSEVARAYELLAETHYLNNNKLPCLYAVFAGIAAAKRTGLSTQLARSCGNMSIIWGVLSQHRKARAQAEAAHRIAGQVGDSACIAWINQVVGIYRVTVGSWDKAEQLLRVSVAEAKQLGDKRRRAESTSILGLAITYQGRFDESSRLGNDLMEWGVERGVVQEQVWGLNLTLDSLLNTLPGNEEEIQQLITVLHDWLIVNANAGSKLLRADMVWGWGLLAKAQLCLEKTEAAINAANETARIFADSKPISYYTLSGLIGWADVEFSILPRSDHRRRKAVLKAIKSYGRMYPIGKPWALYFQSRFASLNGYGWREKRCLRSAMRHASELTLNPLLNRVSPECPNVPISESFT